METYIPLESEADSLNSYTGFAVHGLAQTENYARALFTGIFEQSRPDEIEKLVRIRMGRREDLVARPEPLSFTFILDEGALYRRVGDARIMREQLTQLLEFSEMPEVRFRVLPFDLGNHLGNQCSYGIFQFNEPFPVV